MKTITLRNATVLAEDYEALPLGEAFRFKNVDMRKGLLQKMNHRGLIEQRDDVWSTTTWEWTAAGRSAQRLCEVSPITEASPEQLHAFYEHAEVLLMLPLNERFFAGEYDMRGQCIQTLAGCGLMEKADTSGQVTVWELSTLAVRVLSAVEARSVRMSENNSAVIA